jgi:hypothetical protein
MPCNAEELPIVMRPVAAAPPILMVPAAEDGDITTLPFNVVLPVTARLAVVILLDTVICVRLAKEVIFRLGKLTGPATYKLPSTLMLPVVVTAAASILPVTEIPAALRLPVTSTEPVKVNPWAPTTDPVKIMHKAIKTLEIVSIIGSEGRMQQDNLIATTFHKNVMSPASQ